MTRIDAPCIFSGEVVKEFRVPAQNQELVLLSFEEMNWPVLLLDPLPPKPNIDSKQRLHDTINRLNRCQTRPLIRFEGDGTGKGIRWRVFASGSPLNRL